MGTDNNEVKKNSRQYSDEFKEEAVKMSQELGVKATAIELGIHAPMLSNWRKKILNPKAPKKAGELSYAELLAENKRLKKENGWIKDINEVLKKKYCYFFKRPSGQKEMILEVKKKKPKISYEFLCNHFGVSRASFFEWKKHKDQGLPSLVKKSVIKEHIADFFKVSKETYGSPRIYDDLKEIGITVSENTVAKYMVELGLDARQKKKYHVMTTDSNHSHPIAPRLFKTEDEHCLPTKPGMVLAGDITYLKLSKHRHVYLAVVMDLYNREIVGWSVSDSLESQIVLDALDIAMKNTSADAEIIFHSDRGSQYASEVYRKFLKNKEIKPSLSILLNIAT